MIQKISSLILILFVLSQSRAFGETITWIDINYPSAYFLEGDNKNKGFAQVSRQHLMNATDEFEHKVQVIGVNRFLAYLKNQKSVHCTIVAVEVDQYDKSLYSNVAAVTPPTGIVIRAKDKSSFSTGNSVSLQKIIDDSEWIGGLINNGHYGEFVNYIISNDLDKGKIHRRHLVDPIGLYKMLGLNRVDYIIEHPFSFDIQRIRLPASQSNNLVFMPIEEQTKSTYGRVLCNKTESSSKLIKHINQILKTPEYKQRVAGSISGFLPKEIKSQYYKLNIELLGEDLR